MQPHFVQIDVTYEGQLRTKAVYSPSGNSLVTDAPVDNMGKGQSFSPTDLLQQTMGVVGANLASMAAR